MSNDIRPGDVVVRVAVYDDSRLPAGYSRASCHGIMPVGTVCRVVDVIVFGRLSEIGLIIQGWPSVHKTKAWHHAMFRKIEAPKTELSERIRACRPVLEDA